MPVPERSLVAGRTAPPVPPGPRGPGLLGGAGAHPSGPFPVAPPPSSPRPEAGGLRRRNRWYVFRADPSGPTLGANPFPEVTDLACRLPLLASFRGPEAVHLGDRMRWSVRAGTRATYFQPLDFSRHPPGDPDAPHGGALFLPPAPFSARCDSGGGRSVSKKRELSPGPERWSSSSGALPRVVSPPDRGTLDPFPFRPDVGRLGAPIPASPPLAGGFGEGRRGTGASCTVASRGLRID